MDYLTIELYFNDIINNKNQLNRSQILLNGYKIYIFNSLKRIMAINLFADFR